MSTDEHIRATPTSELRPSPGASLEAPNLVVETHGLTRFFDDFCAVDAIDLRVGRGTFYGFLGPNGAGKSTTIKMLTGLLAPSEGRILLLGHDLRDADEALAAKAR